MAAPGGGYCGWSGDPPDRRVPHPVRLARLEQVRLRPHHQLVARRQLVQQRDVVHDPERPAHRREHEVLVVHADVGHRRRRQVLLERLPVAAVVERHEHAELGAGVEQALLRRVLPHDARRMVGGDAVAAVRQARPRGAVVGGGVDVRLQVVLAQEAVDRDVGRALSMRRVFDGLHATAGRKIGRRHLLPRLPGVARDVHRAVVRADPQHALLEARLGHRVDAAVDLLTRDVARDRGAWRDLLVGLVRRQVVADDLPGHAFVGRPVQHVRCLVDRLRIVRREVDHRLPREAVLDVFRVVAVPVLRVDPVVLLLAGRHDVAARPRPCRRPRQPSRRAAARPDRSRTPTPGPRSGAGNPGPRTRSAGSARPPCCCPAAARRAGTGTGRRPPPCRTRRWAGSGSTTTSCRRRA